MQKKIDNDNNENRCVAFHTRWNHIKFNFDAYGFYLFKETRKTFHAIACVVNWMKKKIIYLIVEQL